MARHIKFLQSQHCSHFCIVNLVLRWFLRNSRWYVVAGHVILIFYRGTSLPIFQTSLRYIFLTKSQPKIHLAGVHFSKAKHSKNQKQTHTHKRTHAYIHTYTHNATRSAGVTSVLNVSSSVCCIVLQCVAVCCSVLQGANECTESNKRPAKYTLQQNTTHCNTLQDTATDYSTVQRTAQNKPLP